MNLSIKMVDLLKETYSIEQSSWSQMFKYGQVKKIAFTFNKLLILFLFVCCRCLDILKLKFWFEKVCVFVICFCEYAWFAFYIRKIFTDLEIFSGCLLFTSRFLSCLLLCSNRNMAFNSHVRHYLCWLEHVSNDVFTDSHMTAPWQ